MFFIIVLHRRLQITQFLATKYRGKPLDSATFSEQEKTLMEGQKVIIHYGKGVYVGNFTEGTARSYEHPVILPPAKSAKPLLKCSSSSCISAPTGAQPNRGNYRKSRRNQSMDNEPYRPA
jgi:hypothetical protein